MNVLGVILARGGSKGVPKKNLKMLAGVPLVAYTIIEAQKSKKISRLILSSEDPETLELGKKMGCITVKRPDELATDHAASPPCVIDAVKQLQEKNGFETDVSVLMQPTTPFRRVDTIDKCVEVLEKEGADSVVSVTKAPHFVNPHWVRKIENGYLKPYLDVKDFTRRQDLPDVYWRNGQIYCTRRKVLFETKDFYGEKCIPYIMDDIYQVNIDATVDFRFAEYLLEAGEIDFDVEHVRKEYGLRAEA